MAIRIWHQSHTVLEDLPDYAATLRRHLDRITGPETEVVMHGLAPGTFPSEYPGTDIAFNSLFTAHNAQWIINGVRAQRDGFDAYAMCTFPNPRIEVVRSLVDIPVTGYGESCAHFAGFFGRRFGVLNFIEEILPLYEEQLRSYGLGERIAGLRTAGFSFNDMAKGFQEPGPVIDRFMENARRFIKDTGCDVIIPGEMVLNVFLADQGVSRVDDVPVLDGLGVTIKLAEMLVDLRRTSGMTVSRRGIFHASPPAGRFEEVMGFYGLEKFLEPKP